MDAAPPAAAPAGAVRRRRLTVLDCVGLGINGVIGSGIFFLPAAVFRRAGGLAPLSWLLVGGLFFLVGLCFAEAASYTERSGGPYAYARLAFGRELGFAVGFVALASMLLGFASVARGLTENLAAFVPAVRGREGLVGAGTIAALAAINLAGIKPGAWTSNLLSAAKLVPLLLLAALGLTALRWSSLALPAAPHPGEPTGLWAAAMAGVFACTGFEFVSVPAGETRDPSRAIPLALLGTLGGSVALYALLQAVADASTAGLGEAHPALMVVADRVGGAWLARLLGLGAVVSALGFCASSVVIGPSYLAALAEDDMLPAPLARRSRTGAPAVAVLAYAAVTVALNQLGDFQHLADMANIAAVVQYLSTCTAVLVLRRSQGQPRFRLPLGPLIPLLSIVGCLAFLRAVRPAEAAVCAAVVATGFALRLVHLGWRRAAR